MNANNLLFGVLLTVIGFQVSEALEGVKLIELAPRKPYYTKTLILDLDETLIHSQDESNGQQSFTIQTNQQHFVHLRDGVVERLRNLEKKERKGDRWELIIWTLGKTDYANKIVKHLEGKEITIAHIIGRETGGDHELEKFIEHRKDIRRLINPEPGNDPNPRTLETMVIVDNKPEMCYPGENTIGIRSWYGFNVHLPEWLKRKMKKEQDLDRSYTWSIVGHDEGKAMKQLMVELDELAGKMITSERLNDKLRGEKRGESEQMIYYISQPMIMSKQIEMVRKAGRDRKYTNTLILDLYQDFLYYVKSTSCRGERDCWKTNTGEIARPQDGAINTLKTLQQKAPGGKQCELINWTDSSRGWTKGSQFVAKDLRKFLSENGVEVAHQLEEHIWDTVGYHFEKSWTWNINQLVSETRPLESIRSVQSRLQSRHQKRQPQGNIVDLREQYSSCQIEMVREAERDKPFTKTLILNSVQDFISIDEGTTCARAGKEDCWEVKFVRRTTSKYALQCRDDAISTLQKLQKGESGSDRWEFIIWTDLHRIFVDKIVEILLQKGVQITHILDGSNWDDSVEEDFFDLSIDEESGTRDIMQLANERRPLDSMFIAYKGPMECWNCFPKENSFELKALYRYLYSQIDTVREVGRHERYQMTLILNLEHDFVYIDKGNDCGGDKDCELVQHDSIDYAVQFRDDAISTLKSLQEGGKQWELIIWTDLHREFAEGIAEILRQKGVDIAYVLAGRDWNNVGRNFHQSEKDIERLASEEGRPLDSMLIVHNNPSKCLPRGNAVGIRSWYGRDMSGPHKEELDWYEKALAEHERKELMGDTELINLSLSWPKFGCDDAMKQLESVLDGLNRQSIGVKRLSNVIFSEAATTKAVKEKKQMVYFQQAEDSKRIRSSTGCRPLIPPEQALPNRGTRRAAPRNTRRATAPRPTKTF